VRGSTGIVGLGLGMGVGSGSGSGDTVGGDVGAVMGGTEAKPITQSGQRATHAIAGSQSSGGCRGEWAALGLSPILGWTRTPGLVEYG
jgi:hypothetical protein